MLQIPDSPIFVKAKTYISLTELYLPEFAYPPAVPLAKQQAILQQLDTQIKEERFYIITDVKTGAIKHCNGISRWLGYTDAHFTQKKYLNSINPAHAIPQGFYAAAFFEILIGRQIPVQFLQPINVSALALKNKNGKYIYCMRKCSPFQLTECNKVTEYISEFTIVKELTTEEYYTRICVEGEKSYHSNEILKRIAKKRFEDAKVFSIQELRMLKRYAGSEDVTSEMIAKAFKIGKGTVNTFNKRILRKSQNVFGQRFDNAKKAAEYFRRVQLI